MTTTSTESTPPAANPRWALRFFTVWSGAAFSLIGTSLVQFALVWWFAKTTGSATALAFSGVVGLLPAVLLGPIAGALVDRWDRRWVMIISDGLTALSTLALIILFLDNQVELWEVYLVLFIRSVCSTFHTTSMQASTALMVPPEHLTRVAGVNQTLYAVLNIGAAPLGALIVNLLPMTGVLMIDVVTAVLAILPLCFVSVPNPPRAVQPDGISGTAAVWRDLKEGFRYVLSWRGLLYFCLLAAVINFLSAPLSTLLPLMVTQYFGGDTMQLGAMTSVYGIGMMIGAVTLSIWGGFKQRLLTTLTGLLGTGFAILLLGFSASVGFWLGLVSMAVMGCLMPIMNGPIDAVLQSVVAPEKQGRVFNLVGSLTGLAMPVGLMVAGPLADAWSLPVVFLVSGALFLVVAIGAFRVPALMTIENRPSDTAAAVVQAPVQG